VRFNRPRAVRWTRLASGLVEGAWQLRGPLAPAVRQGMLAAIPVGVAILLDLELDLAAAGAISTGALLAGFVAFDAPPSARLVWQLLTAPVIGAAAALGALTGEPGWLAVVAMVAFASAAGITVAVSARLSVAAMSCTLALLLAQGLAVHADQAIDALLLGAAGAALQGLVAAAAAVGAPPAPPVHPIAGARAAWRAIAANLTLRSRSLRHALRWGTALGAGVAAYHVLDLGEHGYWIPLTVLFVLKPSAGETWERIAMRAAGTLAGLALATPLALALGPVPVANAAAMTIAAGFALALLAIEYALFTAAITSFVVLLAHGLGQDAWQAADQRALGTLIGLAIAGLAFALWSNRAIGGGAPANSSRVRASPGPRAAG
jgi:fusaric acid resistance family protein